MADSNRCITTSLHGGQMAQRTGRLKEKENWIAGTRTALRQLLRLMSLPVVAKSCLRRSGDGRQNGRRLRP